MRISEFARRAFGISGTAALLSGCGGSQVGSLPGSSANALARVKSSAYTWHKYIFPKGGRPPYPVRTKVHFFRGTVPVVLAPFNYPGTGLSDTYALLDHTDSSGDYAVYDYYVDGSGAHWSFSNLYLSSILKGQDDYTWGITKGGIIWSNYPSAKWTRYFRDYTSLAAQNPTEPNPAGYLFATSSKSKTNGSSSGGPSGPTLMLYDPSKPWPRGTWSKTGWGAEQVAGDPATVSGQQSNLEVVALDENANAWEILPVVKSENFDGYQAVQLATIECAAPHPAISFEEVAAFESVLFALDQNKGHAVWYYDPGGQCWDEIGTKSGFTSIAPATGSHNGVLVWAVDVKGNLWSAY